MKMFRLRQIHVPTGIVYTISVFAASFKDAVIKGSTWPYSSDDYIIDGETA